MSSLAWASAVGNQVVQRLARQTVARETVEGEEEVDESAAEPEVVEGAAPAAPGFSPDTLNRAGVVALQRLVGNAAAAEMMQARERPEVREADHAGAGRAVVDGEREGRSSEAIAGPSRAPTRLALVQRSPWDTIKDAASDAWSGAKNLAGKAGDLIAKKIIGPLRDIAGGIGKAVSSLTSRFGKALSQAKPDFIDYLAPAPSCSRRS